MSRQNSIYSAARQIGYCVSECRDHTFHQSKISNKQPRPLLSKLEDEPRDIRQSVNLQALLLNNWFFLPVVVLAQRTATQSDHTKCIELVGFLRPAIRLDGIIQVKVHVSRR